MTKKKVIRNLADVSQEIFREKLQF